MVNDVAEGEVKSIMEEIEAAHANPRNSVVDHNWDHFVSLSYFGLEESRELPPRFTLAGPVFKERSPLTRRAKAWISDIENSLP